MATERDSIYSAPNRQIVTPTEKALYMRLAGMGGWEIAKHFGCEYAGDMNPIDHGGFFYDTRDWERWKYANIVEFWSDGDCGATLIVVSGTVNKPDNMEGAFRRMGIEKDDPVREDVCAQIEAARHYGGYEFGDERGKRYKREEWKEWRIWRSVAPWLAALGD